MDGPLVPSLPGYDGLELIAHGTSALVFRAIQRRPNRPVAIKVITAGSGSLRVDAAREFATTVALSDHPHIVSIIETGVTDDDRPFIVMEYCEGGSYAQLLRRQGPLPLADVIEVGTAIGGALQAAHQFGILHRDVKPSNILRARSGPALTDFGIARAPGDLAGTITREIVTPYHASPEALLHQAQSASSDVYSLASTMWTLLVGHPPFADPARPAMDIYAFRDRVLNEPLPAWPRADVPDWLATAVRRALSKLPADRHASAAEFVESLRPESVDPPRPDSADPLRPVSTAPRLDASPDPRVAAVARPCRDAGPDADPAVAGPDRDDGPHTDLAVDRRADPETGLDTSPDAGLDSSPDAGLDTSPDAGLDTSPDAGLDTSPDAGYPDAAVDAHLAPAFGVSSEADQGGWRGLGVAEPPPPAVMEPAEDPPGSGRRRLVALLSLGVLLVVGTCAVGLRAELAGRPGNPALPPSPASAATEFLTASTEGAPSDVRLTDRGTSITLSWRDLSDGTAAFGVVIRRGDGTYLDPVQVPRAQTRVTVEGLDPNTSYCFVVVAVYSVSRSAASPPQCTAPGRAASP